MAITEKALVKLAASLFAGQGDGEGEGGYIVDQHAQVWSGQREVESEGEGEGEVTKERIKRGWGVDPLPGFTGQ